MAVIEGYEHLARLAVEFVELRWNEAHAKLFPQPPNGIYWTVRLGRLALQRDSTWAYWARLNHDMDERDIAFVRAQRFETLDEAVEVARKVFGREPEHVQELRQLQQRLRG